MVCLVFILQFTWKFTLTLSDTTKTNPEKSVTGLTKPQKTMSSDGHHSLLPLLTQLQVMEDTITNFMIETILKLQSLTDVKVFLLLDYPQRQKRRYCGSKETMEAFEDGTGLNFSVASDVAVELDADVATIVERTSPRTASKRVREQSTARSNDSSHNAPLSSIQNKDNGNGPSAVKKMRKSEDSTARLSVHDKTEENDDIDDDDTNNCKNEIVDIIPEYFVSDDENDDNDDGDNGAVSFLTQEETSGVPRVGLNGFEGRNNGYEDANYTFVRGGEAFATVAGEDLTSVADVEDSRSFFDALDDPHLEHGKLMTLINAGNISAAYVKGTTENRLMKSVCYSVGKNAALKCPISFSSPSNKEMVLSYWSHHCDLFARFCGKTGLLIDKNLVDVEKMDCLRRVTAVGYLRQSIRDGFKKIAGRRKAQLQ